MASVSVVNDSVSSQALVFRWIVDAVNNWEGVRVDRYPVIAWVVSVDEVTGSPTASPHPILARKPTAKDFVIVELPLTVRFSDPDATIPESAEAGWIWTDGQRVFRKFDRAYEVGVTEAIARKDL